MANANVRPLLDHMVGDIRRPLFVLLAATGCVLLIACLNVANLLIARAAARRKELAIRTAMGGGWLRLVRERLMESFLLPAAGGAVRPDSGRRRASVAAARTPRHGPRQLHPHRLGRGRFHHRRHRPVRAHRRAHLRAQRRRQSILAALHESSRAHSGGAARTRLRRTLLVFEVGLTVVLLIGAGLLLKSYERMRSTEMGCATDNVLTMRIGLPGARYKTPGPAPVNFFNTLLQRLRAFPGVQAAGLVTAVPGQGYWGDNGFTIVEHPPLPAGQRHLRPQPHRRSGLLRRHGHSLPPRPHLQPGLRLDQADEIVVSDGFVKKFLPGEEPLGKHINIGLTGKTYTIVGVVGDTRYQIGELPMPMMYLPYNEGKENYGTLVLRSSGDVEQLAIPVQQVIQGMDRDLPVADVLTMNQLLGKSMLDQSFNTTLLVGFGALSLLLAAVGLFGVLSYMVAQRTAEIGIRMALGAPRSGVLGRVLLDGLRPAALGLRPRPRRRRRGLARPPRHAL